MYEREEDKNLNQKVLWELNIWQRYNYRHPDRNKKRVKKYRVEHLEICKERVGNWRRNNPGYQKDWAKNNKEKTKQYTKKWRENNPEKVYLMTKRWRENNRDKRNIVARRYNGTPRGRQNKINATHRRRMLLKDIIILGTHTFLEWEKLRRDWNFICLGCGVQEPAVKLVQDHIIPLSRGGSDVIDNIQPLCHSCNSIKRDKIIDYRIRW